MNMNLFLFLILTLFCCRNVLLSSIRKQHRADKRSLFIAGGTKWCGAGNIAQSCDDLGDDEETDKCCREHDNCPYAFAGNDSYMGFKWNGFIATLSHCECDRIFHECLSRNENSYFVKSTYFSGLKIKCFAFLPCELNDNENENIYFRPGLRRLGDCVDSMKVRVFNSIDEYGDFMQDYEQRYEIKTILNKQEKLMSQRKLASKCRKNFSYLLHDIVNLFEKSFLNETSSILNELTDTIVDAANSLDKVAENIDLFDSNEETTGNNNTDIVAATDTFIDTDKIVDETELTIKVISFVFIALGLALVVTFIFAFSFVILQPYQKKYEFQRL